MNAYWDQKKNRQFDLFVQISFNLEIFACKCAADFKRLRGIG